MAAYKSTTDTNTLRLSRHFVGEEARNSGRGDLHPGRTEMVAEKVETGFDPADERLTLLRSSTASGVQRTSAVVIPAARLYEYTA